MKAADLEAIPPSDRKSIEVIELMFGTDDTNDLMIRLIYTLSRMTEEGGLPDSLERLIGGMTMEGKWAYCRSLSEELFDVDLG